MKKMLLGSLVIGLLVISSGCQSLAPFSSYNHNRIKEQEIGKMILVKGNAEQIKAVNAGIKPSSVLKIIPTSDGRGAYMAIDLFNPDNWTYFKTYGEAPVSSTVALLGDGTLWTGLIWLGGKAIDGLNGGGKQETNIAVNGDGSNNINVNSSGNKSDVTTSGGAGGNNINVNSSGNTSTIENNPPPVTE